MNITGGVDGLQSAATSQSLVNQDKLWPGRMAGSVSCTICLQIGRMLGVLMLGLDIFTIGYSCFGLNSCGYVNAFPYLPAESESHTFLV